MKDYLVEIFGDIMMSWLTKKYGTKLSDDQRLDKYVEEFRRLKDEANFSVTSTQSIFDKKGINSAEPTMLNGEPVFRLTKSGMFGKVKVCYYISRIKDEITVDYLDKIFDELRRQANNENVFSAPDYKN
ncbi:MAG: hypothetical protein J6O40_08020 [Ruminococcus sp.]|nr:hypothetical protein [Ruminococcus sp.]